MSDHSGGQPPPGEPGGQGPYPPSPPYGAPPPYGAYYPVRETEGMAIAVLVTSVCSFFVCPVVPAIIALALAPTARRNIAASGGRKDGESLITAGVIIAWVNIGLVVVVVLVLLLLTAALRPR